METGNCTFALVLISLLILTEDCLATINSGTAVHATTI
jgi:hypothetical protein